MKPVGSVCPTGFLPLTTDNSDRCKPKSLSLLNVETKKAKLSETEAGSFSRHNADRRIGCSTT
jgi:hypothetical protein